MRELNSSEREFKSLVKDFINQYFELDKTCSLGYSASNFDIEYCFNISDLCFDYPDIKKNTVIKYMILSYPFLEKGFKRRVVGITADGKPRKGSSRMLKNIKVKDGIIKWNSIKN